MVVLGLLGLVVVSLMDTEGWPMSMTVTETEAPVDAMASSIFWLSEAEVSARRLECAVLVNHSISSMERAGGSIT